MTAAGAFGEDTPRGRFLTWTAHLLVPLAVATFVIRFVVLWAPDWLPLGAAANLVSGLVLGVAMLHYAFGGLCVRCMRDVPEDAGRQAERRRWLLWSWHHFRLLLLVQAALIGVYLVGDIWFGYAATRVGADVMGLVVACTIWSHHRLRPWCPYCRDWDDHGPVEPSPVPPAGVKQS